MIVEAVSNFFRSFHQDCCDKGKEGNDEAYRGTPPCGPEIKIYYGNQTFFLHYSLKFKLHVRLKEIPN